MLLIIMNAILCLIVGTCLVYSDLIMFGITRSSLQYDRAHSAKITSDTISCIMSSMISVVIDSLLVVDCFVGINAVRSALAMLTGLLPFENSAFVIMVVFVAMGAIIAIRGVWMILMNFMSDMYCSDSYMCKACFLVHFGAIFMRIGACVMSI